MKSIALTRADLESQQLQRSIAQENTGLVILTDAQLQASITEILSQRPLKSTVWIFAYGSLIWNPVFEYSDRQIATLQGWHRSFCIWTPAGRGTPVQPGLTLALEPDGHCCGVAYQMVADPLELLLLWRREMVVGSYIPRWVTVETSNRTLDAIAFTVNPQHSLYAPNLTAEEIVQAIITASGSLGSCKDYLVQTVTELTDCGMADTELRQIFDLVVSH